MSIVEITPAVRKSLDAAGIYSRYHGNSIFSHQSQLAKGLSDWLRLGGEEIKRNGGLVVFHGTGMRAELMLTAREFHLRGAGCRVLTLPQWRRHHIDSELREDMDDSQILFLSPAQSGGAERPLRWDGMGHAEAYINDRLDMRKAVFLWWAHDKPLDYEDPEYRWWSDEFMSMVSKNALLMTRDALERGDT